MVFRRSDLELAGGLERVAWALGEDAALSDALAGIGLRTTLTDRVTRQSLARRSWTEVWNRQLRWRLIWRTQAPAVFVAAPLGSALLTAVAGAIGAPIFGYAPITAAFETFGAWFCVETILCLVNGWPTSLWSPIAFVGKEILDLAVWLKALTTTDVAWAGAVYHARVPVSVLNGPAQLSARLSKDVAHDA
jgi:ceramide glucosyltransferase